MLLRVTPDGVRLREAKSVLDPVRVEQVLGRLSPADREAALKGLRAAGARVGEAHEGRKGRKVRKVGVEGLEVWREVAPVIAGGLVVLVAGIAAIGSMLPRNHKASRTCGSSDPRPKVWPVIIQATEASDVPVDVLESHPPHRLVTRVTEKEKNFGGTWTIAIAPTPSGARRHHHRRRLGREPVFRFVSRFVIGHHATMDALLKQVAKTLSEPAALSGE